MRKIILISLLFFIFLSSLGAFEFSVSPNENGSTDVLLKHQWEYGSSWYSGFNGEYRNTFLEDDDELSYVTTTGNTLSLSTDIIGYQSLGSPLRLSVAGNFTFERMDLREIGYIDQVLEGDTEATRFFILNDRIIDLFLPRIVTGTIINMPFFTLKVAGEYSPFLQVKLNQELTISPGSYDREPFTSSQSTNNAWSVNGTLSLPVPFLEPEVFVEYDHLNIVYDVLTAGGESSVESIINTLSIKTSLIPRFINLQGFYPTVSLVWEKNWTKNIIGGTTDDSDEDAISFQFGFSR